ncbi:MAG: ABC transporter permease [Dehalococcoidia bacterium]
MRELWVLIRKELRSIRREKTILFAIVIQLFIAGFSSILLVGVTSFYDPSTIGENAPIHLTVGVIGDDNSPVAGFIESHENVRVVTYSDDFDAADKAFRSGRVNALVYIPPGDSEVVEAKIILPKSDAASMLILMTLDEPLKKAENYLRELSGIELRYNDLEGKTHTSYEFFYSIIVPVLMFFPALIAGSITVDTISEELQDKTLDTLWSAPLSLGQIFSSKIVTAGATALAQCALWVLLLEFNFLSVENIPLVLLLATIVAFFVAFGAGIIALLFGDRERAQFVYSISLVVAVGSSYYAGMSPFTLITRLSSGGHYTGIIDVAYYLVPLTVIGMVFWFAAKRLAVERG